ncbi:anaerobic C4-dicarboxylate transporter family protein [uncultured Prevotella sp.]|uniref:anaerobic C4-dicarboxylate transporter family protein n=1 Tax=uncultured Prevotella sp. TaxID=159272 RepID=UPI0026180D6F|nr:anaerobic C4-dicarboxylate transporter family protein [uncultured Prevotella sp.]
MATAIILLQFAVVLALIFKGARVGGIGLGIYGMVGVFILVFIFGLKPGNLPIDVMLIIVSVITAAATLQAAGGLDYLVGLAAKFLRKHPTHITYFGPLTTWLFCLVAGTAHTSYSLLPIISEIATNSKIRPERPLSVATISASLGITGSPVSAATAAVISTDLLGGAGIELKHILIVCIPASLIAILVAAFVQNRIGKELNEDEIYQERVRQGIINPEKDSKLIDNMIKNPDPHAKYAVMAFLLGVLLVVIFGSAWMGDTFFNGNLEFFKGHIASIVTQYPFLFAIALFIMAIMLFSQAATVRTLYPLGIGLGISPLALIAMFPAVNGYFFLPNYPTTVAAINFDRTGSTRIGRFVINHSFQLAGFITTFVSIGVGYIIIQFL